MHDDRINASEAVFDEESDGLNDAGTEDWGEKANVCRIPISCTSPYPNTLIMYHGR